MFVDDTPVRVLRNLTAAVPGYPFPSKPAMLIRGSIWDGSSWATDGGRAKVDWSGAPITAAFRGFDVDAACAVVVGDVTPPCDDKDPAGLGPLRRAAGGVRGRQEQQHGVRLLHGRAPVQQPWAAGVQLRLRLTVGSNIIGQLTCEQ